jgi:hypothetical protein
LRCNQLGLSQAVITEERLALEDAIRKVEAEAAHNSRTEMLTEPQPAIPSVGTPSGGAAFEPLRQGNGVPDARGQQLNGPSSTEGEAVIVREVHDFDAVTPRVMQTAPPTRGAYEEEAIEPILDPYDLYWFELDTPQKRDREDAYAADDERVTTLPQVRATRNAASDAERMRRSPSYGALATLLVALIMVVGLAAAVFWEWSPITQFYVFLSHTGLKPQSQVSQKTPSAQPKLLERVPQQQSSVETPGTTAPGGQTATTQRVVLYEENPADPQGKRYSGAVVWRTETFSAGPGLARLAVRAVVTIPELRMAVIWALRHSADKAAYTIETTFNLPADFPGGGIANVPGILMKQSEQARGTPLAGLAVKVMNGFFIIGLSADETDAQRNEQLLKERSWFDIPIVYTNGGRAILAIEKGPSGDRAFGEAFDAWEKK